MKNRYKKFVLKDKNGVILEKEAEKGIFFKAEDGRNGELIIRTIDEVYESNSFENYANPPIPEGYEYLEGDWNNGLVIQRKYDGSQFVWVPVGFLNEDGTLDGIHFNEKFGKRKEFSDFRFNDELEGNLLKQSESVKKYGGFYISRYNISKNTSTGKPQSLKGFMPWTDIYFNEAKRVANSMEESQAIKSHLIFGAEYDSILAWFIKSGARSLAEIKNNSTEWGNYWNTKNSPREIIETGSCEKFCTNNIYDIAGNLIEWTQEKKGNSYGVVRGGDYGSDGDHYPVVYHSDMNSNHGQIYIGFRAALYIK